MKTLVPAYGRDYKSGKAAKEDFLAGKDFILSDFFDREDGRLCNLEDMQGAGVKQVGIRYKAKTQQVLVTVPQGGGA